MPQSKRSWVFLTAWIGVLLGLVRPASSATPPAPLPPPVYSRQNGFVIPFRMTPPLPANSSVEVALYVSEDQGAAWRRHSATRTNESGFRFRAERDGEFWFTVRTHDASGAAQPGGAFRPELRVIVDTVPPELQIVAEANQAGAITVQIRIHDPHLKPESFKLEYLPDDAADAWEAVAVDPIPPGEGVPQPWYGQVTLWPTMAATAFTVRAAVADAAGNPSVNQVRVQMPGAPAEESAPDAAAADDVVDESQPQPTPWPADEAGVSPTASNRRTMATTRTVADQSPVMSGPALGAPGGATRTDDDGWRPVIRNPQRYPVASGDTADGTGEPTASQGVTTKPSVANRLVNTYATTATVEPPPAVNAPSQASPNGVSMPAAGEWLPPGVRPRMVNSTRFQLDYDVESVGPWGVRRVELWGTRDGGRTWDAYGVDDDNQSPVTVTVEAEGTYGFRVLVHSGSGLVESPPQSGDLAEVWIGVDLTPPVCRITGVDQGTGERAGQLIVHWEADDAVPADRPISLSFAAQPTGPWMPVASGLRNTGRYVWQLDGRTPDALYLRLECRDEAGNVAVYQPEDPYPVAPLRPRGRIRDVRPVTSAP